MSTLKSLDISATTIMGNSSSSSQSSSEEEESDIEVPPQPEVKQTQTATPESASKKTKSSQTQKENGAIDNPYKKTPRLTAWICLFAASVIVMTSLIAFVGSGSGPAIWVCVVAVISIVCSVTALVFYCFFKRKIFVDRIWGEGVCSYLLLVLWIGGLGVCMSPKRGLAVTRTDIGLNVVKNANLYFSSWFAFICIFYICASWTMAHWTKAAELIAHITGRLAKWWILLVVSIIVLVSASHFHTSQDCPNAGKTDLSVNACTSNRYAVALGAFGSIFTLVTIIISHIGVIKNNIFVEFPMAVLLFALYTAGVGIITYNEGSGVTIGNLYFASWTGFVIALLLLLDCYHEFTKLHAERKAAKAPKKEKSTKRSKKKKKSKQQPAAQQSTIMQSARGLSMRSSSLGDDDFCDARDDLELAL